jgi:hypothetical protein
MAAVDDKDFSSSISTSSPLWSVNNNSTGQSSVPNQIHASTDQSVISVSTPKISLSENSIFQGVKIGSTKVSANSTNSIQIASSQISLVETIMANVGGTQVSIPNDRFVQPTISHENSSQIGSSQIDSIHHNFIEISSPQVDISQNHTIKIDATSMFFGETVTRIDQFDSSKVTLPVSIPFQQFVVSNLTNSFLPTHDLISDYLTQLQSTLATYWNLPTSLNLNFDIINLPTGQLAEAIITGYDQLGRPNTATISIDDDANGVGWFIDTTPAHGQL